jgi:hypothetical protein
VVVRDRKDMTLSVAIGDEDHNEWFLQTGLQRPRGSPAPAADQLKQKGRG